VSVWQDFRRDFERIKAGGPLVTRGRVWAFVMLIFVLCALRLLPLFFPLLKIPPRACCSCVCKKKSGDLCPVEKRISYTMEDCKKVCRAVCKKKRYGVRKASSLPVDQCGKLTPYL